MGRVTSYVGFYPVWGAKGSGGCGAHSTSCFHWSTTSISCKHSLWTQKCLHASEKCLWVLMALLGHGKELTPPVVSFCLWLHCFQEELERLQKRLAEAEAAEAAHKKPKEDKIPKGTLVVEGLVIDEWVIASLSILLFTVASFSLETIFLSFRWHYWLWVSLWDHSDFSIFLGSTRFSIYGGCGLWPCL